MQRIFSNFLFTFSSIKLPFFTFFTIGTVSYFILKGNDFWGLRKATNKYDLNQMIFFVKPFFSDFYEEKVGKNGRQEKQIKIKG